MSTEDYGSCWEKSLPKSSPTIRFIKIGIPTPQVMTPFVGVVEILFGSLLLLGLFARLACIPLLIDIGVAIATTKVPMLLKDGVWKTAMKHGQTTAWSWASFFLSSPGADLGPLMPS